MQPYGCQHDTTVKSQDNIHQETNKTYVVQHVHVQALEERGQEGEKGFRGDGLRFGVQVLGFIHLLLLLVVVVSNKFRIECCAK